MYMPCTRYTCIPNIPPVGRRVTTLCKHEAGLRQQLALYHAYYNFCLPHANLPQALPVWSNYSNAPFRPQLYITPCAFLVLHSTVPCFLFTIRMRGTRGGGTA